MRKELEEQKHGVTVVVFRTEGTKVCNTWIEELGPYTDEESSRRFARACRGVLESEEEAKLG